MGLFQGFDSFNKDKNGLKANEVTQKAICFIQSNKENNFFLWLHYFDPHGPYKPPSPYNKIYLEDNLYQINKNIPISTKRELPLNCDGKIPYYIQERGVKNPDYYISQYDGEISFTDEQIGILFKKIEELDLAKNTIVIITADHGEGMGEHNIYFTHGAYLYDEFIRIPLIIKYGRKLPADKTIGFQVGHIDIMPTILSLLKIKPRITMEGMDLTPFISGEEDYFPRENIFSEDFGFYENKLKLKNISIRTCNWKLIHNVLEKSDKLFDLNKDPKELFNLVYSEEKQYKFIKAQLETWMKHIQSDAISMEKFLSDNDKEKLRSLGYLR